MQQHTSNVDRNESPDGRDRTRRAQDELKSPLGNARERGRWVIVLWTSAKPQGRWHRPPGGLGLVGEPTPRMRAPSRGCPGR